VLARVESGEGAGFVFDALEDETFRSRLGEALSSGASFRGSASSWVLEPTDRQAPFGEQSRVSSAEQSNTSVLYGKRAVLKIYRRLAAGLNPDVEIAEFLERRARFSHVPRLLGTIRFHDADGSPTVAGMAQALVDNQGDGWAYALERVRAEVLDGNGASDRRTNGERPLSASARRLGEITCELHAALASDPGDAAFAPLPVSEGDLENWGGRVALTVKHAGEILAERAASGALAPSARGLARECLAHLPGVPTRIRDLVASLRDDGGSRIRHHGDYHLGQVLVGADQRWIVLDFEGEPARTLVERRRKRSPLRDVAGMLRSLGYAAATARAPADWEAQARAAFLSGYRAVAGRAAFLPGDEPAFARALAVLEVEKAAYEVVYEANNRPDWVTIPARGLVTATAALRSGRVAGAP